MRRGIGLVAWLLVLAGHAAAARAQPAPDDMSPATWRKCATVANDAPPASDLPTAAQVASLHGCDAEALYYGIGRKPDPVQARLCAFTQHHPGLNWGTDDNPGFAGRSMLMAIYANGIGARRDLRLAMHYACTIDAAPAEYDARVADLAKKAATHWAGHDFSWCDDITSGFSGGVCAEHVERVEAVGRAARLAALAARLHGPAIARFAALRRAQAAWAQARAAGEIDESGTLRGAFYIEEKEMQDRDFLDMLDRLAAGHKPPLGPTQLRSATARMEAILRRIAAAPQSVTENWGTVRPDAIAKTQVAWTRYRDAWGAFAVAAYPHWGADAAEAWVTMKRADMLAAFLQNP